MTKVFAFAAVAGACAILACQRDHENPFDPAGDPFNLEATGGEAHIELIWDVLPSSPTTDGVAVERKLEGEESFTDVDSVLRPDTLYTDYRVVPDTTYVYRVRGFRDGAFTAPSKEARASATSLRPPTSLLARDYPNDLGRAILLEWTAAPADSEGGTTVLGYNVYRSYQELDTAYAFVDSTPPGTTSHVDSVFDRTTYYYKLAAKSARMRSSYSNVASAQCSSNVTLRAPTWLDAADVPGDQGKAVRLAWGLSPDDVAGLPDFEGYSVFRSFSVPGSYDLRAEVGEGESTYVDTTALPGSWHYYRVRSRGAGGTLSSGFAEDSVLAVDDVPPGAPSNLRAADTPNDQGGSITITWDPSPDDESGADDVISYAVCRGVTDQYSDADSLTHVDAGEVSYEYVDTGLPNEEVLYYWVRSWDSASVSDSVGPASAAAHDNLLPAPPTSLQAGDFPRDGGGVILLQWDLSEDDGPSGDVVEYRLFRRLGGGTYPPEPAVVVSAGTSTSVDTTEADTLEYYYVARAWDGTGDSEESNEAGPVQSRDDLPPHPIADLTASGGPGEGEITVVWTAPSEDSLSGGATEAYDLRFSNDRITTDEDFAAADSVEELPAPAQPGEAESVVLASLETGRLYYFALRSVDDAGNWSGISNVDSASPGGDTTPPPAVADLQAAPGAVEGEISVRWTAPGDDGPAGDPVQEYDLRYDTESFDEQGFEQAAPVPNLPPPGQPATIDSVTLVGLEVGVRYYFRLKSVDDAENWSSISNLASSEALGDTTPPARVEDLVASTGALEHEVILAWTSPGDDGTEGTAATYYIRYGTEEIVTLEDWDDAWSVPAGQVPAPSEAGTPETLTVEVYLPTDVAWLAIRTEDDAGNLSPVSNSDSAIVQGDVTAPGTITDLTAETGDEGEVRLQWTAPHEDGTQGNAVSEYAFKHHSESITADNWENATTVLNPPTPSTPGSVESLLVQGLVEGMTYYFAVRSADEVPNWSEISNSPFAASGSDVTRPGSVSGFTATAEETTVELGWTNPGDADVQGTELRYSTDSFPTGPWDGSYLARVWGGPWEAESHVHATVSPGTTYFYAAFAFDDAYPYPNFSTGSQDSATPGDFTPPGPVTEFQATGSDASVALTWANPSDLDFQGTVIRYSTTDYPPDPDSGLLVVDKPGTPGQSDSYSHSGLQNGQSYYYAAFAYDDGLPERNYSEAREDAAIPGDTTPPASVTGFEASAQGADTVRLVWENPADEDFVGTRIRYSTVDYPTGPEDGTLLIDEPGEASGADEAIHGGVTADVVYYYAAFAYDEIPNYATAAQDTARLPDTTPPASVTGFEASAQGADTVRLVWENPADEDFVGTRIRYSTVDYPTGSEDGTLLIDEPGEPSGADEAIHGGVTGGVTYYYAAFAFDEVPNYAAGAQDTARLPDTTPPASVTGFETSLLGGARVRLSWDNPTDEDFVGTRIRYDTADYPAGPDDGTLLIDEPGAPGGADSTVHEGVTSGVTYYYAAFAFDEVPNYAAPAQASADIP